MADPREQQSVFALKQLVELARTLEGKPTYRRVGSVGYSIAALLTLIGLLGLVCFYLTFIVAVSWLVYWHWIHNIGWIKGMNGAPRTMVFMLYILLGSAGAVILLFLIKPLFQKQAKPGRLVMLNQEANPALFHLIYLVCDLVGAARPKIVQVHGEVNASAGFSHGLASFLRKDLVLTLGMPLIAGVDTRLLAGIIAHEFGHFRQGAGMRLSFLIRAINLWFARIVYERDGYDVWLENFETQGNWFRAFFVFVSKVGIQLGRSVIKGIMILGRALSAMLSRQMEYDADAVSTYLVGSKGFGETLRRLNVLDSCHAEALALAEKLIVSRGELPDDIPELTIKIENELAAEKRRKLEIIKSDDVAPWYAGHPSHAQRIQVVRDLAEPGFFDLELPSRALLSQFKQLCLSVTEAGLDLSQVRLLPAESAQGMALADNERLHGIKQIFGAAPMFESLEPLPLAQPMDWPEARLASQAGFETYIQTKTRLQEVKFRLLKQSVGHALLDVGFRLDQVRGFDIYGSSDDEAKSALERLQSDYESLHLHMKDHEAVAMKRMSAALAWPFQRTETSPVWCQRISTLVQAQRTLSAAALILDATTLPMETISCVFLNQRVHPNASVLQSYSESLERNVIEEARKLTPILDSVPITLSQGWKQLLDAACSGEIAALTELEVKVLRLQAEVVGDLCLAALEIEKTAG
jgi:Zn-dependent protease with chaperone function